MGRLCWLALGLVLTLAPASPSVAKVVAIETTFPLGDHTEESVRVAPEAAVKEAVTGAMAMGLRWVRMSRALVLESAVVVQILATDKEPEEGTGQDAWGTHTEPETRADESPPSEV